MSVLIHCPCTASLSVSRPPPSAPPLSLFRHHPLSALLFCEECDAVRCDSCVTCEIACYYCPNCLFEVPSASVRGEKNRCARNCFQCPQCCHTLSVVASDPDPTLPLASAAASVGEPPYYLACAFCHWDSKEVGITFEKPTGLAVQLQKLEDGSPELVEFDHLKDHLEPFIRRGQAHVTPSSASSFTASSILKDIPGLGPSARYGSLFGLASRARTGPAAAAAADGKGVWDDLEKYESVVQARDAGKGKRPVRPEEDRVRLVSEMTDVEHVAPLDKRWATSWNPPFLAADLKPLRTPLQSKRSKRCPECKHILIKPEQKSSSTRFKIKLVASNYLPSIELYRRPPATIGSRLSAIAAGTAAGVRRPPRVSMSTRGADVGVPGAEEELLRPGRTYTYELAFTNPLYEPIHVRLAVARPPAVVEGQPPPYAVNLPSPHFPISAYAEEWEYEEDDDVDGAKEGALDEDDEDAPGGDGGPYKKQRPRYGPGVVERRMNRTTVVMEVAVGKDTVGPIRANMLVTYVYQADDGPAASISPPKSPTKKGTGVAEKEDQKSFSFWALVSLGVVTPRAEGATRRSLAASSSSG